MTFYEIFDDLIKYMEEGNRDFEEKCRKINEELEIEC